jgi:hypothetical protein
MSPESAGYSGTPLVRKLGFRPGARVYLINPPKGYLDLLGADAQGIEFSQSPQPPEEFVHLFVTRRSELSRQLARLREQVSDQAIVWVSWPKRSSAIHSDITDQVIRDVALPLGFVDTKVCAVDQVWSGLKLMIRRSERKSPARAATKQTLSERAKTSPAKRVPTSRRKD